MSTMIRPNSFNVSFFDEQKARKNFRRNIHYVVGYARLSFDEDGEGFCSILNQQSILQQVYDERFQSEISSYEFIADDNVTGYKFERPGLFKLLQKIEDGYCSIILAKDLSRIGRHSALTQLFIEQCERVGIRIVAMDDYDSRKESDDLILGIRAWSNERVVKDTSAKILKIVKHKQANGTWFCAAPYGYIVVDYAKGLVEIDDVAAKVMNRIAQLYLDGKGVNAIAKILSFEGIPTPSQRAQELAIQAGRQYLKAVSGKWTGGQISKMLDDDFYIGNLRTGKYKRQGINGKDVHTSAEDQYVFENHHPAIWTKETFEAIKRRRKNVRTCNHRGGKNGSTLYHGLLYCGDCGSKLYTFKNPVVQRQYICSAHFKYGKSVCSRHTLKESTLTQMLLSYLQMIHDNCAETIATLNKDMVDLQREAQRQRITLQTLDDKAAAARKQLEVIEIQRIKQIIAHPEREDMINATYDGMVATTQAELQRIEHEIALLESASGVETINTQRAKTALDVLQAIIDKGSFTRQEIEALIERVTVFEDGNVIIQLRADVGIMEIPSFAHKEKSRNQKEKDFEVSGVNVVCDGDPLEIYTDRDGEVILKKYSPIGEMSSFAKDYTESLWRSLGHIAVIVDRDQVIAASGVSRKELWDKPISHDLENAIAARQTMTLNRQQGSRTMAVTTEEDANAAYTAQVISPIIADGEAIGAVLLMSRENGVHMGDTEIKVAETAAGIVGRQMEQ